MKAIYGQPKGKTEIVFGGKRIVIRLFHVDYVKDGQRVNQYRAIARAGRKMFTRRGQTKKKAVSSLFLDIE